MHGIDPYHIGSETRLDGYKQCIQKQLCILKMGLVYARLASFQIQNGGYVMRVYWESQLEHLIRHQCLRTHNRKSLSSQR